MIAAVVPNLDKKDTDRCTRALVKKLHSLGADVWMRKPCGLILAIPVWVS